MALVLPTSLPCARAAEPVAHDDQHAVMESLEKQLGLARKTITGAPLRADGSKEPGPGEDSSSQFGALYDEALNALDAERAALLRVQRDSPSYRERMKLFIRVNALCMYEPGQPAAEIGADLRRKCQSGFHRAAFEDAMFELESELRKDFLEALFLEDYEYRNGNGD